MLKVLTVVGARPQFIKAAAVSRVIEEFFQDSVKEVILNTGQHYDANMSSNFFEELNIPKANYNLNINGGTHGNMTGSMLAAIETVLFDEKPDCVLVYGDTNSTLAGALAAAKMHIPVAHVEAGLRSFNMKMPEEINRVLTDRVSERLYCPTSVAVENLKAEGFKSGIKLVGDVMYDISLYYRQRANERSRIVSDLRLNESEYFLLTCHRQENTDDPKKMQELMQTICEISKDSEVVFPVHPRTRKIIEDCDLLKYLINVRLVKPLPYLDMVKLEQSAKCILTDSGGVQKEAFFFNVPCVTLREETEWVETVELGKNIVTGISREKIFSAIKHFLEVPNMEIGERPYGDGEASKKIIIDLLR